jgi:hypothetical protein
VQPQRPLPTLHRDIWRCLAPAVRPVTIRDCQPVTSLALDCWDREGMPVQRLGGEASTSGTQRSSPRRASSRETVVRCHFLPRAVGTCRWFSSSAMAVRETTPAARSCAIVGATVSARASAARLVTAAPLLPRWRGEVRPGPSPLAATRTGPQRRVAASLPPPSAATARHANAQA